MARRRGARALRLAAAPGFLALASLTLSLGVAALLGAATLLDALYLKPPPWPNHERVVVYGGRTASDPMRATSVRLYDDVGAPVQVLARGLAYMPTTVNVVDGSHRELLRGQRVEGGFLETLGVEAIAGRRIGPPRDGIGEAMLSYPLWKRWFDGEDAVGRTLAVDGEVLRVMGVLPEGYRFFADVDLLLAPVSRPTGSLTAENMTAVALLAHEADRAAFAGRVADAARDDAAALHLTVGDLSWYGATPIDDLIARRGRGPVWSFAVCAWLVLLVAGANVSNLMQTRSLRRAHEMALQTALGATAWRPHLATLTDALVVATIASAVGIPLGMLLVVAFRPLLPHLWLASATPLWPSALATATTFGATLVIALAGVAGVATGRAADALMRQHLSHVEATIQRTRMRRARTAMIFTQSALATLVLVLGIAAVSRYHRVDALPLGFDDADAAVVEMHPDIRGYPSWDAVMDLFDAVRRQASGLPGIDAFGWSTMLPIGSRFVMPVRRGDGETVYLRYALVTPGAAQALGFRLVAGRWPDAADRADAEPVALVNQAYVDQIDGRGLGGTVTTMGRRTGTARVVGIIADVARPDGSRNAEPLVVVPFAQGVDVYTAFRELMPVYAVIRGPAATVVSHEAFGDIVGGTAPTLATGVARPLERVSREAAAAPRRDAVLFATLAAMAVSLACVGHYSLQAFDVASRRRALALRGALGASPRRQAVFVLRRALGASVPGVLVGTVAVLVAARWLTASAAIRGVTLFDLALAVATMLVATTVAVLVPASRAASVEPWRIVRRD